MKLFIGSDHASFQLKEDLKKYLAELGHEVEDLGAYVQDPEDDYPDLVLPVGERVAGDPDTLGIVLGKSGNGEAIAANKVKGVRAALCLNGEMAKLAREHNNANILSLGADFVSLEEAKGIVKTFLETPFSGEEKHERRIEKITAYESSKS